MDGNGLAGQFLLTERLQARIGTQVGKVDVTRVGHKLVVGTSGPEAAAAVRAWVATLLDERGEPAFVAGEFPDDPGSVALTLADESITADRLAGGSVGGEPLKDYVTLSVNYTGTHQEAGVLLLYGDGLAAGARLPDARLLDVAPTILAAAGLPASAQMPGKAVGWPEVPRVPSWDGLLPGLRWQGGEAGGNEEMLEALGYSEGRKPDPAPP